MKRETIFEEDYANLYYYPEEKIVYHEFKPSIGGEGLKNTLNTGTELLRKHNAKKWLSDNRAIEAHTEEETKWINTHWLPDAIKAGWKVWALVVPQSVMARINMTEFVESFYEKGVRIMVFVDSEEAFDWLVKVGSGDDPTIPDSK
jgi:hypothetical protein